MGNRRAAGMWLVVLVALTSCIESDVTRCEDHICPADRLCDEVHGGCVLPDQLTSCDGAPDGGTCPIAGVVGAGVCDRGVCVRTYCGDALVSGAEECDGGELGARPDCTDHEYYDAQLVACTDTCRYDLSACTGFCGDAVIDAEQDEACDQAALDGKTCLDFGFYETDGLACSVACTFVAAGCSSFCGDGLATGNEDCDDVDLRGADCTTLGFYAVDGLGCNDACAYDTSDCAGECGDGAIDPDEDCDGDNLDDLDCTDFDFYDVAGLTCTGCGFNVTACTGTCPDGIPNGVEYCDGAPPLGQFCTDYGFDYGRLGCTGVCSPDFVGCGFLGWRQVATSSASLRAVWGSSARDVFAAGSNGAVIHFDGSTWTTMSTGTTASLAAIHGTGPTDVWAVGGVGLVLHYDGTTWSSTTVSTEYLSGVFALAPDDVIVVGFSGAVQRWNGTSWSAVDAGTTQDLHSVWASGPGDIFATTQSGSTAVLHFDGTQWESQPIPVGNPLADLWGTGPTDVYTIDQSSEQIWHYDGVSWSPQPIEIYTDDGGIGGSGADDVWAVGNEGALIFSQGEGRWTAIAPATTDVLQGVWSAGRGDFFAVGTAGVILRGGASWADVPATAGYGSWLRSPGPGEVLRVGINVARFDGTRWHLIGTGARPAAAAIDPGGRIYAGGAGLVEHDGVAWTEATRPYGGGVMGVYAPVAGVVFVADLYGIQQRIGGEWTTTALYYLHDISGSSFADIWVVGSGGQSRHWDGATWTPGSTGVTSLLRGVWARVDGDAFAVGDGGVIRRWNGTSWAAMSSGTTAALHDVWGAGPSDVFAVGAAGAILHFDGTSWSAMTSPTTAALHDVWGRGASEVYAVGASGTILRYDGTTWTAMASGVTSTLTGIHGNATELVAVGGGAVLQHTGMTGWVSTLYAAGTLDSPWGPSGEDLYLRGGTGSPDLLVHYDGVSLTPVTLASPPETFRQLRALAADAVFAIGGGDAGAAYTVYRYDTGWSTIGTLPPGPIPGLFPIAANDVLVTQGVRTHRYDGTSWTVEDQGGGPIYDLWHAGGGEVFTVGEAGVIRHRVGGSWSTMESPSGQSLRGVWGHAPDDVFAVGDNATFLHYDGVAWSPIRGRSTSDLRAVTGSAGELFVMAEDGIDHLVGHLRQAP